MDLTSPTAIKELLSKYETRPSKGLGQNFLIDKNVLDKIVDSADIKPNDFILEVGPGLGTLTQKLAEKAGQVVAVEKDKTMVEILKETLKNFENVKVISGDILKTNFQFTISNFQSNSNDPISKKYKVVANIPYYLTSPLIRALLENENSPETIVLLVQKEVAERICAKPGQMSLLAVSVQFYAEAKIISTVSKNSFWPSPKVDSAIIKITPHKHPVFVNSELFFKVVKAAFSQPRKQLVNNLTSLKSLDGVKSSNLSKEQISNWLLKNNLKPSQRAETLSIADWINLTKTFIKK